MYSPLQKRLPSENSTKISLTFILCSSQTKTTWHLFTERTSAKDPQHQILYSATETMHQCPAEMLFDHFFSHLQLIYCESKVHVFLKEVAPQLDTIGKTVFFLFAVDLVKTPLTFGSDGFCRTHCASL